MTQHRVAVAARKGGVGKTTIACGVASVLAKQGKQVLVVDLDPQSNAAYALGVDPTAPGTAELLTCNQPSPLEAASGLYVLPGGPNLTNQTIQSLHPEDLADLVKVMPYDAVILDCPPGNESLERLGLVAALITLVVTNAHPFAIMGANRVMGILESYRTRERRGPKQWALVLSQVDERRALDKELPAQLVQRYSDIKHFTVHQDTNLSQSGAQQIPLMDFAPRSRSADELTAIAQWVMAIAKD
ncbi:MAG: ParA family protein [Stenomitos rutilans HA7619-LM2]|jgi:chromosome partitioning protein|nr:ParA family protein [Stenomitos rutilans HA7619-LM2]